MNGVIVLDPQSGRLMFAKVGSILCTMRISCGFHTADDLDQAYKAGFGLNMTEGACAAHSS